MMHGIPRVGKYRIIKGSSRWEHVLAGWDNIIFPLGMTDQMTALKLEGHRQSFQDALMRPVCFQPGRDGSEGEVELEQEISGTESVAGGE